MRRFTRLYLDLDATNATSEKCALLESYFRGARPEDAAWALALFTGGRPKRAASSKVLKQLAIEHAQVPPWLFAQSHTAVGDLSETIALILPQTETGSDEPLHQTIERRVVPLATASDSERRQIILDAWDAFDADQRFVFHKLIRGGFRVGVQTRSVARALAPIADVDAATMSMRLAGGIGPTPEAFAAVIGPQEADDTRKPYPFYLAHQITVAPDSLGDVREWFAEWKWDGIRAQLIARDEPILWSRGDEVITHQFPEVISAAAQLLRPCVLDGEIVLMRGGRPLPFAELQTRLNRKAPPSPQMSLFATTRAVFMAFDALEADGVDLRPRAFTERRAVLEGLLDDLDKETELRASPPVPATSWDELADLRDRSRSRNVEGLMLKHAASPYGVGRTKPGDGHAWWKWKVDPFSVDAVLTFAQPGSGRRASLLTDYTFALWDSEQDPPHLVTFAKAYSGLTNDEIERLDRWIRRHTVRTMGPVREVEPMHVFEIGFEDIRASTRHRSGIAVRFPRILRWREDKPIGEADTLQTLRALADARGRR